MSFEESYIGKLRKFVGHRYLKAPCARMVIVNEKEEILLDLRSDLKVWGIFGGSADEGECVETCMKRETKEELNIDVLKAYPFGYASKVENGATTTYPNGDYTHGYDMCFCVTEWKGEFKISEESLAIQYYNMDELPEPLHPNVKPTIEAYKKFKQTGEFQLF